MKKKKKKSYFVILLLGVDDSNSLNIAEYET